MSLFHSLLTGISTDTTALGEQVFGIVGDSNADGRGDTIPVVGADTLYLWDGAAFDEITTQSVANEGGGIYGSIWQQFATDYKASSSRITLLVNGALGGAEFYPNGDNNNWYTSGDLYVPWRDDMRAALAAKALGKPKAIFVNLGINDVRGSTTLANITTGVNSLVARIKADFPNTDIVFIQVGRTETSANNEALFDIRRLIVETCENDPRCHMCGSGATFVGVTGGYNGDNLHYSQAANDHIGAMLGRWMINGSRSKWARSVISSHFDELSSTRKGLIETFISTLGADFHILNGFLNFKTTDQNNTFFDWTFLGLGLNTNGTFVANSHIATSGAANQTFSFGYLNAFFDKGGAGQNDFRLGVKLKTRSTAAGTAAVFFGRTDASGNVIRVGQAAAAGTTNFHANVLAAGQVNGTEADLVSGTLYTVSRDGLNQYLHRNKVQDATASAASSGACDGAITIGYNNNNGTLSFPFNGQYEYCFAAPYTSFDYDAFYDAVEVLIAGW